jgi:hypothetical protein
MRPEVLGRGTWNLRHRVFGGRGRGRGPWNLRRCVFGGRGRGRGRGF